MQVTLSRRGDYSVRSMLYMARHADDGRRKARQVAEAMEIPERYLTQILANLVAAGLLKATAGPDGGYELLKDPKEITLLQVVEAAEGPVSLERCVLRGGSCEWVDTCPVHETWSRAQQGMTEVLATTTFADLAQIDTEMRSGTYRTPEDTPAHIQPTPRGGVDTGNGR